MLNLIKTNEISVHSLYSVKELQQIMAEKDISLNEAVELARPIEIKAHDLWEWNENLGIPFSNSTMLLNRLNELREEIMSRYR